MSRALRATLVGIVLANLGFAYITDASRWIWLGPFVLMTVASPWLARWADRWWFRAGWNAAVLGAFAMLVHDTVTSGAAHLLEDGLLLATLAQVHLLNNIGRLQQPDILFFNSFLIALVTSFLSVHVGYSLVFLAYAPLLILGLQLRAAPDAGPRGVLGRTAVVLGCTLLAFFFVPRDFQRRGIFADAAGLRAAARRAEVDFSPEVELGELANVSASSRVVLRIHRREGDRAAVPEHWRGATLDRFDGRRWRAAHETRVRYRQGWRRSISGSTWVRGRGAPEARVDVERVADTGTRLPVPLGARTVQVERADDASVRAARDLTFRSIGAVPDRYRVGVGPEPLPTADLVPVPAAAQDAHVMLPGGAIPAVAQRLAATLRAQSPDLRAYVDRAAHHLRTHFRYLAPGSGEGATSLGQFLRGDAGGHCEYFASALVVLLRLERVPCRLVTGFRSAEWDEAGDTLVVRARHAHAWVEVLDENAGWFTVDPTPPGDGGDAAARLVAWTRVTDSLSRAWQAVVGFNARAAPDARRAAGAAALLALAVGAAVFAWRRVRARRRLPAAARRYARTLKRLGLGLRPGETPRELLRRPGLDDRRRSLLEEATRRHEAARYALVSPTRVEPGLPSNG